MLPNEFASNPRRPRFWIALLLGGLAMALGGPAMAELGAHHMVMLMPGSGQVEIPIDGWIVAAGESYDATVLEAPQFGAWQGETYLPGDDFWTFGGDRVVLSLSGAFGQHTATIVLVAGQPHNLWHEVEDFETSNGVLSATSLQVVGNPADIEVTGDALDGLWSLAIDLSGDDAAVGISADLSDIDITGVDQMGGCATLNPDLPGGGGGGFSGFQGLFDPFTVFELNDIARVQMRFQDRLQATIAQVRAQIDDVAFGCGAQCVTPWRDIPLGQETEVGLWYGRDLAYHPSETLATLHFVVKPANSESPIRDRLTDLPRREKPKPGWRIGPLNRPANLQGTLRLDLLESWWDELMVFDQPQVLADDFDSGVWDARWQATGELQLGTPERRVGALDWVAVAGLSNPVKGQPTALLVDPTPRLVDRLRAEMQVDLRYSGQADGAVYTIWGTATVDGGVGHGFAAHPVELEATSIGGSPFVRARVLDDLGLIRTTRWLPAGTTSGGGRWTPITVHWWAGKDATGGLRLRVGQQQAALLGVANSRQRIEEHGFGAWDLPAPSQFESVASRYDHLRFNDVLVVH